MLVLINFSERILWFNRDVHCCCAYIYLYTGVGGFSTPIALAAPMLVSLGHEPLRTLVAVVCFNGLSAHLGELVVTAAAAAAQN